MLMASGFSSSRKLWVNMEWYVLQYNTLAQFEQCMYLCLSLSLQDNSYTSPQE